MKISISYPPLESKKGTACLSQNRQFQWLNHPTYIYPIIPAYAATILQNNGYDVFWDDAIAEELSYDEWKERIWQEKPDIIAIETKTPVIQMHWQIIDELKEEIFSGPEKVKDWNPKIVLMGDHVTALPRESFDNSWVDYVIASGDFDFLLLNLADHLTKGTPLEGGFWYVADNTASRHVYSAKNKINRLVETSGLSDLSKHDINSLPLINRELTRWQLYANKNGNFKSNPGSYIMSARDCWWGQCSFCSWAALFPADKYRVMSPEKALAEVENLVQLGVREIMEDSGTLPVGKWLDDFCEGLINKGLNKKVQISCNMRLSAITNPDTWKKMKEAGFRFILFGLESANQETLDKINKNLKVEEIEPALKMCKSAGLSPHITAMIGYPWETKAMAENTLNLAKKLLKNGYTDTLQATIIVPYPGTPLYEYCRKNNWLLTRDYSRFDQRELVIKSPLTSREALDLVQGIYKSAVTPQFIMRQLLSIRSPKDIIFLAKSFWKWLGKIMDFSRK